MRKPPNPCGRNCGARTITCKFDGTCNKYEEYQSEMKRYRDLVNSNKAREFVSTRAEVDRHLDLKEGKRR